MGLTKEKVMGLIDLGRAKKLHYRQAMRLAFGKSLTKRKDGAGLILGKREIDKRRELLCSNKNKNSQVRSANPQVYASRFCTIKTAWGLSSASMRVSCS